MCKTSVCGGRASPLTPIPGLLCVLEGDLRGTWHEEWVLLCPRQELYSDAFSICPLSCWPLGNYPPGREEVSLNSYCVLPFYLSARENESFCPNLHVEPCLLTLMMWSLSQSSFSFSFLRCGPLWGAMYWYELDFAD